MEFVVTFCNNIKYQYSGYINWHNHVMDVYTESKNDTYFLAKNW